MTPQSIRHPDFETPRPHRLIRIPVARPPVAAVVSSPDGGETFAISGLTRHEATFLAVAIAENPVVGYVGHDLGRAIFPAIESEATS